MCLIIACASERPSIEDLIMANAMNNDGIGLAHIVGGQVFWQKGISLDHLIEQLNDIPFPFVVHFRLATVGGASTSLCHPFPISFDHHDVCTSQEMGYSRRVLFHNGHISSWRSDLSNNLPRRVMSQIRYKVDSMSDSQAMALLAAFNGGEYLKQHPYDKFALLSAKEGIQIYGNWIHRKGISFSNSNHRYYDDYYSWLGHRSPMADLNCDKKPLSVVTNAKELGRKATSWTKWSEDDHDDSVGLDNWFLEKEKRNSKRSQRFQSKPNRAALIRR